MKPLFCLLAWLCPFISLCQQYVTGYVHNTQGQPVAHATVTLLRTAQYTQTNSSGRFNIPNILPADSLRISAIGYQTITLTDIKDNLTITLQTLVTELDEVMINTGYQQLNRAMITGAYSNINTALIDRSPGTGLLQRLDGVSNILFDKRQPGDTRLQLRGLYTLSNNMSQPLIVVDNFPFEGSLNDINPNDVAQVTLLKDAAAASVWGARAGNGVIVITTKKGKPGKTTVQFSTNQVFQAVPDLQHVEQLDAAETIALETDLFNKGYYNALINNTTTRPPLSPMIEMLLLRQNGHISTADSARYVQDWQQKDIRNDFEKYIYQPVWQQQYALTISGGTDKYRFNLSAGYDKNREQLKGNSYERISSRLFNSIKLLEKLTLENTFSYTFGRQLTNSPGAYGTTGYQLGSFALPRYASLVNADGKAASLPVNYRDTYTDTVGGGRLLDWKYRPLDELAMADNSTGTQALLTDINIRYKLNNWIDMQVQYRYQLNRNDADRVYDVNTYYARNLINLYTNLQATAPELRNPVPVGGMLSMSRSQQQAHNLRAQVNVDKSWRQHRLSGMVSAEMRHIRTIGSSNMVYGYNTRLNITPVDYVNRYPRMVGSAASIPANDGLSDITNRYLSLLGNLSYAYKQRYTAYASVRRDASNLFGVKTNDKWSPFFSAGGAWNIASEPFYRSKLLHYLTLRLSHGYSGNISPSSTAYTLLNYQPATTNSPANLPFALVLSPPNPGLRWEKVHTTNIGLDVKWGKNNSASIEYYIKRSRDVLASETLEATTGFNSFTTNSANIKGKGLELQLQTVLLNKGSITWNSNFLLNYVTYKLTGILSNPNTKGFTSSGDVITPLVGYDPYSIVSYAWAGLDGQTGNPIGYVNGEKSMDYNAIVNNTPLTDQVIHGSALPPVFGNWLHDLSYKNLSLSFNIIYRLGHYFRNNTINYGSLFSSLDGHVDYRRRWQQPGDEAFTQVPSMIYPNPSTARDVFYTRSEITVSKAGFVRLNDIRLSYTLKINTGAFKLLHNWQFFAYATNLNILLWKAEKNIKDPEFPTGARPMMTYTAGLRASL